MISSLSSQVSALGASSDVHFQDITCFQRIGSVLLIMTIVSTIFAVLSYTHWASIFYPAGTWTLAGGAIFSALLTIGSTTEGCNYARNRRILKLVSNIPPALSHTPSTTPSISSLASSAALQGEFLEDESPAVSLISSADSRVSFTAFQLPVQPQISFNNMSRYATQLDVLLKNPPGIIKHLRYLLGKKGNEMLLIDVRHNTYLTTPGSLDGLFSNTQLLQIDINRLKIFKKLPWIDWEKIKAWSTAIKKRHFSVDALDISPRDILSLHFLRLINHTDAHLWRNIDRKIDTLVSHLSKEDKGDLYLHLSNLDGPSFQYLRDRLFSKLLFQSWGTSVTGHAWLSTQAIFFHVYKTALQVEQNPSELDPLGNFWTYNRQQIEVNTSEIRELGRHMIDFLWKMEKGHLLLPPKYYHCTKSIGALQAITLEGAISVKKEGVFEGAWVSTALESPDYGKNGLVLSGLYDFTLQTPSQNSKRYLSYPGVFWVGQTEEIKVTQHALLSELDSKYNGLLFVFYDEEQCVRDYFYSRREHGFKQKHSNPACFKRLNSDWKKDTYEFIRGQLGIDEKSPLLTLFQADFLREVVFRLNGIQFPLDLLSEVHFHQIGAGTQ